MATTTNYNWPLPTVDGDAGAWGGKLNTSLQDIDTQMKVVADAVAAVVVGNAGWTGGPLSVANGGTGVGALGTGIVTALAVNVGTDGAPVIKGGELGTPTAGVATNLTGTASGLTAGTANALNTSNSYTGLNLTGTSSVNVNDGSNHINITVDTISNSAAAISMICQSAGVFLAAGATSWASLSDETQKTDLERIENATDKVQTVRAVTYRYKADAPDAPRRVGLIAQDVQKVLPEAVSIGKDGLLRLSLEQTVPLLFAALQETNARLTALEQRA